jgi:UrcA family protein
MFNSDRTLVGFIVMAALTMVAVPLIPVRAQAADNSGEARSVTLQYHATDLDTPEGVASMYRRIRGAAAEVCSPFEGRSLERKLLWNDCFSHAVANAVRATHNEALSAYHWQRIRGWKHPESEVPASLAAQ